MKSFNKNTYCYAKINNEYFYGEKDEVEDFWEKAYSMRKINNNISGNYEPEFFNFTEPEYVLICQQGNWKNVT